MKIIRYKTKIMTNKEVLINKTSIIKINKKTLGIISKINMIKKLTPTELKILKTKKFIKKAEIMIILTPNMVEEEIKCKNPKNLLNQVKSEEEEIK